MRTQQLPKFRVKIVFSHVFIGEQKFFQRPAGRPYKGICRLAAFLQESEI
jgi:hypothetical protein